MPFLTSVGRLGLWLYLARLAASTHPTPAPWSRWPPSSSPDVTTTAEPTDDYDGYYYPTASPQPTYDLYPCPPTSAMARKGFSSEFDGCVNPSGCRFLATPSWDLGAFEEKACWHCCSSARDQCGICTGCECGYSVPSAAPTVMPTYGYPPLDDDVRPEEAARMIWADAARDAGYRLDAETALDYDGDGCLVHPIRYGGTYDDLVRAMIRALNDRRLTWSIEGYLSFWTNLDFYSYRYDDDPPELCASLTYLAALILQERRYVSNEVDYQLRQARDAFLERMEREDDGEEGEGGDSRRSGPDFG